MMLALPVANRVRRHYPAATIDTVAAQCALALMGAGHAEPSPGRLALLQSSVEVGTLRAVAAAWLDEQQRGLEHVQLGLHIATTSEDLSHGEIRVHLGNASDECWGPVFTLKPAWEALSRASRLSDTETLMVWRTALNALTRTAYGAMPLLTPAITVGLAESVYWWGEKDEAMVLEQYEHDGGKKVTAEDLDLLSRVTVDEAFPPTLCQHTHRQPMRAGALKDAARRSRRVRPIVEATLALIDALSRFERSALCPGFRKSRAEPMEFQTQDGLAALGTTFVLRWSTDDLTGRIFDDHGHQAADEGYSESYGWWQTTPQRLPQLFDQIAARIAVLRAAEQLINLIAKKVRE